jgi:hypothetical protein
MSKLLVAVNLPAPDVVISCIAPHAIVESEPNETVAKTPGAVACIPTSEADDPVAVMAPEKVVVVPDVTLNFAGALAVNVENDIDVPLSVTTPFADPLIVSELNVRLAPGVNV